MSTTKEKYVTSHSVTLAAFSECRNPTRPEGAIDRKPVRQEPSEIHHDQFYVFKKQSLLFKVRICLKNYVWYYEDMAQQLSTYMCFPEI